MRMKKRKNTILHRGMRVCSLVLALVMVICMMPQMSVKADDTDATGTKLEEDWSAMSSAAGKMKMTNTTTKAQVMKVILAAAKNGTKATWKSFRKVDATYDSQGAVTAYANLSLNGKTRELYINEKIPTLGNNRPTKGITVSEDEWNILRLTNIERAKKGETLLTMPAALQKAATIRAKENVNNTQPAHTRPDGTSYKTAVPSSFKNTGLGENMFKCTKDVTPQLAMRGWMNSAAHKANILRTGFQYMGVGTYQTEAVQIFASSAKKIKSYTTSTGKTTFADEEAMVGEYLICTDQAGVKSYLPLDTTYMKKVSGGYTINLNATKTVKIKIKNAASSSKYTDVDSADAKAVAWVVNKKIMEPTSKNEFYSKGICTKGNVFEALYKANGSPTPKALNWFPDVKSKDSYYKAALWAVDKGLIEYGNFEGQYAYSRGYALYYVWQSVGAPKASKKSTFTDYNDWVSYADAVAWAESKGIIKDSGDHKFRPDDAVTRVELARFIYYAYK